jgi:hypothetical protein
MWLRYDPLPEGSGRGVHEVSATPCHILSMTDEDDRTAYEKAKDELVKALVKKRHCDKQLVGTSRINKSN